MSTGQTNLSAAMYPPRHPLGMPPGSVRALLGIMIGGLFYTLLLMPEGKDIPIPIFLYFLLGLILVFFVGHSHTVGDRQHATPLGVPHWLLKTLHIVAFGASLGWIYYAHPERLTTRLTPELEQVKQWPYLLMATAGGFSLGYVFGRGPWRETAAWQDLVAWVSLLAMLGLAVDTIIVVFINPSMLDGIDTRKLEIALTGVVAFYFGARS